jgi:hypothetical protein
LVWIEVAQRLGDPFAERAITAVSTDRYARYFRGRFEK